jgi:hypothetical protein
MQQRKGLLVFFLSIVMAFPVIAGENLVITFGNDSVKVVLSQDENILVNIINDMRRQNKMEAIPLSADLCKVSQTHIEDLMKNKPQERGCSLHSWSGGGKWTSCCNTKDAFGIECMKSKPREITGYKGDGYELIYWGADKATASDAGKLWKQVDASSDMILSHAKWSAYHWKALGVGIKDGFAILWLGDSVTSGIKDNLPEYIPEVAKPVAKVGPVAKSTAAEKKETKPAATAKPKEVETIEVTIKQPVSGTGTKFYVIVGSFKTAEEANTGLKKIKSKGYPDSFILEGETPYRIAIISFDTKDKADAKKNELKDNFPGIWIYKK